MELVQKYQDLQRRFHKNIFTVIMKCQSYDYFVLNINEKNKERQHLSFETALLKNLKWFS